MFTQPTIAEPTSVIQTMLNGFGTAGTIGIAIIGSAIALGLLVLLAGWGWRTVKKWLASAK